MKKNRQEEQLQNLQNTQAPDTQAQNEDFEVKYKRALADFVNYKNQLDAQIENAKKVTKAATILKIIPFIDDLSRAIKANPDTLGPVQKTLDQVMKDLNLEKIDSAVGTVFDPALHEAISMEDGEGDQEVIAEELRPGYKYEGEVVRAAMVRVKHV